MPLPLTCSCNRVPAQRPLLGFLLVLLLLTASTVSAEVIWGGDSETGAPKDGATVVKEPVRREAVEIPSSRRRK
jgi:hypothetical protein